MPDDNLTPAVTVVIPAHDAAGDLPLLFAALDRQTFSAFDVIVADDASRDSTSAVVRAHGSARLVEASRRGGSYAARNLALAEPTAPVVVFTDADCRPTTSWLEAGHAALERTGAALVAGRIDVPLRARPSAAELLDVGGSFDQERTVLEQGYAVTANLFVRREALDRLGGFDPNVISGGDRQFCLRARAEGYYIAYADDAVVIHGPRLTGRELARKAYRYGVGRSQLPAKGPPGAALREDLWRRPGAYLPRRGPLSLRRLNPHGYVPTGFARARMRVVDYAFQRLPMLAGNIRGAAARRRREDDGSTDRDEQGERAPLRAAFVPDGLDDNPYQRLLADALRPRDISLVKAPTLRPGTARATSELLDVVHLHWLEYILIAPRTDGLAARARFAASIARFLLTLHDLRRRGVRLVWTVHNLAPHESRFPVLERLLFQGTGRVVHALILHSDDASRRAAAYGLRNASHYVAPHGNYIGAYPEPEGGKRGARRELGFDDGNVVFLAFGRVRTYKRLPEVVRAFRSVRAPHARLLVAGSVHDDNLRDELTRLAEGDPRIVMLLRFVSDAEAGLLHGAADVAVVNHEQLFSSGALLLALSSGLPVVAPPGGATSEVVPQEALFPVKNGDLPGALSAALAGDLAAAAGCALQAAQHNSWSGTALGVIRAYKGGSAD